MKKSIFEYKSRQTDYISDTNKDFKVDSYINSELKIKTTQNKKRLEKSISLTPILKEEEKDEK